MSLALLLTFIGGLLASLVTYLVARRTTSGNVNTSDAKTIFEEGAKLREAYREEIQDLRTQLANLHAEATAEAEKLSKQIDVLKAELSMLRATADQLRIDADEWRKAALKEAKRHES